MIGQIPRRVLVVGCGSRAPGRLLRILESAGFSVSAQRGLDGLGRLLDSLCPAVLVADLKQAEDLESLGQVMRERSEPAVLLCVPGPLVKQESALFASCGVEVLTRPVPEPLLVARTRVALERNTLLEEGLARSQELAAILEISKTLNSTLDSGAILYFIARKLGEAMELQRCSFIVPDVELGIGRVIACKDDPDIHSLEINLDNYPEIKKVLRTGERVLIADVEHDAIMAEVRRFADVFREQSIMTLPLKLHEHIIGVLQIRKKSKAKGFSEQQIEYAELLANHAASALRNARLYEDRERQNTELRRQKAELETLSQELQRKNEELVKLTELKEDFTTMIVHDLRSPLMIVQGVLDLLNLKVASDSSDRELIEDGINVTKKMLRLIHNLLEVSRLESGELVLRHEAVDVAELVKESVAPLQHLASSRGIKLATAVADELPPLDGDRARLTQVLDNLVTNAIKFTSEGGQVSVEARLDASGALRIEVEDTGVGIPAEEMSDIFKRFRQGRSAGGRKKGTGLGLTIVDLLVKAHGGRVDVESRLGKGSRFTIHLPAESSKASPAGAPRG